MKKNLILFIVFAVLLTLTWLLTEGHLSPRRPQLERELQAVLENPTRIELPAVELKVDKQGVWRTGSGEVARAEMLDEWHKSMEGLKIERVIEAPQNKKEFFSSGFEFSISEKKFLWGDLSPSGDSFYLGSPNDPDVYVVDLNQVGSLAVADDENNLLRAKYFRLKDLLSAPENLWREERLLALLQFASFEEWKKGDLSLNGARIASRYWGQEIMQAFVAGLQSLTVKGAILEQKPLQPSRVTPWVFTLNGGEKVRWEFFKHPQVDVLYVWVPHLSRAYPVDEASSSLLSQFPERLIQRPFQMQLSDGQEVISIRVKGKEVPENNRTKLVRDFYKTKQNFSVLSLLSQSECELLSRNQPFEVRVGEVTYVWRRMQEAWAILDCETGLAFTWSIPFQSDLDFVSLEGKDKK